MRSAQWYAGDDRNAYIRRAWMRLGAPSDAFDGPQIDISDEELAARTSGEATSAAFARPRRGWERMT